MNMDDLREQWKTATEPDINVSASLLKLKTANMAKDRLYKRLQFELVMQGVLFALLGCWPLLFHFKQPYFSAFYICFVAVVILSIFFAFRFRLSTQKIGHNTLNSKDHLYELYYDARLVMELYKSWSYMVLAFAIMFGLLHLAARGDDLVAAMTSRSAVVVMICLCLVVPLTEVYINVTFGKYVRQVKALLDELREV